LTQGDAEDSYADPHRRKDIPCNISKKKKTNNLLDSTYIDIAGQKRGVSGCIEHTSVLTQIWEIKEVKGKLAVMVGSSHLSNGEGLNEDLHKVNGTISTLLDRQSRIYL
jgi:hypothetical protein